LSAEIRDKTVFNVTWSMMNKPADHLPIPLWLIFHPLPSSLRSGAGNFTNQRIAQAKKEVNRVHNKMLLISTTCAILPYRSRKGAATDGSEL